MEKIESRNTLTHVWLIDYRQRCQGNAGERVDFSTNGTRTIGHPHAKKKET